ncbi:chalcone synthase [Phaffia rhodozyma]|uniref:Chalcone synthase n=1 Tax=Phaffia rhodozyma TaxID=264483 RepID=A0A0F7SRJ5_PHARH|nr:chalcone synthase [Phaffia rhodozyma]
MPTASPPSILGIGTAQPPFSVSADDFDVLLRKHAVPSSALEKTIMINHRTEILHRKSVQSPDSNHLNKDAPPSIGEIVDVFLDKGVQIAIEAAKNALDDWGGDKKGITHMLSTTCTASSYPGFDHFVAEALELSSHLRKTMITGVGCAGGLSILRLAADICNADPEARVLCVACEITSSMMRTEIQSMDESGQLNIPVLLFADGASGLVVGGRDLHPFEKPSFEIIKTAVEVIPETSRELAFDVCETGWRAVITPKVPVVTSTLVEPLVTAFIAPSESKTLALSSLNMDAFIHPGGSLIISSVEQSLGGISPEDHSRASWAVYKDRGNMSSASIGYVFEEGRKRGGRKDILGIAFGPGINVELAHLRRPDLTTRDSYPKQLPRLIEFHEQPYTPVPIREGVQKILTMLWITNFWPIQTRAPSECAAEVLGEVVQELGGQKVRVVDFCSGGGGPMKKIEAALNAHREAQSLRPVPFLCTDLFPPSPLPSFTSDQISYHPNPVDATQPPASLVSDLGTHIRTFCLAFHHFNEELALQVIKDAMIAGDAVCIFELQKVDFASFVFITLIAPLTWILTPFTKPTLAQLFFTYIVPIIPFFLVMDGYVSAMRVRTPDHMQHLINQASDSTDLIDPTEWKWESGRRQHTWPCGYLFYTKGVRTKSAKPNGSAAHEVPKGVRGFGH